MVPKLSMSPKPSFVAALVVFYCLMKQKYNSFFKTSSIYRFHPFLPALQRFHIALCKHFYISLNFEYFHQRSIQGTSGICKLVTRLWIKNVDHNSSTNLILHPSLPSGIYKLVTRLWIKKYDSLSCTQMMIISPQPHQCKPLNHLYVCLRYLDITP